GEVQRSLQAVAQGLRWTYAILWQLCSSGEDMQDEMLERSCHAVCPVRCRWWCDFAAVHAGT
uniref:Transcription factor MYC/MYB N-terminal domain-containing protein n=1 Tax=Aegilops tauschii subsp. strangulata TaxID=200361 RepID=A0A452XZI9_AEGTS